MKTQQGQANRKEDPDGSFFLWVCPDISSIPVSPIHRPFAEMGHMRKSPCGAIKSNLTGESRVGGW